MEIKLLLKMTVFNVSSSFVHVHKWRSIRFWIKFFFFLESVQRKLWSFILFCKPNFHQNSRTFPAPFAAPLSDLHYLLTFPSLLVCVIHNLSLIPSLFQKHAYGHLKKRETNLVVEKSFFEDFSWVYGLLW